MGDSGRIDNPEQMLRQLDKEWQGYLNRHNYPAAYDAIARARDIANNAALRINGRPDRITLLAYADLSVKIKEAQTGGDLSSAQTYRREAIAILRPHRCEGQRCASMAADECVNNASRRTTTEKYICAQRILQDVQGDLADGFQAASSFHYDDALVSRARAAVTYPQIKGLCPALFAEDFHGYIDYWRAWSESLVATLKGEWKDARRWMASAVGAWDRAGARLMARHNVFVSRQEMAAYDTYLEAVELFAAGRLPECVEVLSNWKAMTQATAPNLRFANGLHIHRMLRALDHLQQGVYQHDEWEEVGRALTTHTTGRPTWVLWEKLSALLSTFLAQRHSDLPAAQNGLRIGGAELATHWRLLIVDLKLSGTERMAVLQGEVLLPDFVAVPLDSNTIGQAGAAAIAENLRHILLLTLDYETQRYDRPPLDEASNLQPLSIQPVFDETADVPVILAALHPLLERRYAAKRLQHILRSLAIARECFASAGRGDIATALRLRNQFFQVYRGFPHIVRVTEITPNAHGRYDIKVDRLWTGSPKSLELNDVDRLEAGASYYMTARWNLRGAVQDRALEERFYPARVVRWQAAWGRLASGLRMPTPARSYRWLLQFPVARRAMACRLFAGFRDYGEQACHLLWQRAFQGLPESARRGGCFTPLGQLSKSGGHSLYYLRRAVLDLPSMCAYFRGAANVEAMVPQHLDYDKAIADGVPIVFVDDFLGSGDTVIEQVQRLLKKHTQLPRCPVFICAAVASTRSVSQISEVLGSQLQIGVSAGEILDDTTRAFHPSNTIWQDSNQREEAMTWAESLGTELLLSAVLPASLALGYRNNQALVGFHHNTPDNTLPIFWAPGLHDGEYWQTLYDRYH